MKTLDERVAALPATFQIEEITGVDSLITLHAPWSDSGERVFLCTAVHNLDGGRLTLALAQSARNDQYPKVEDFFAMLRSIAQSVEAARPRPSGDLAEDDEQWFVDWCAEFDGNTDSRREYAAWQQQRKLARQFRHWLGDGEHYTQWIFETEEL